MESEELNTTNILLIVSILGHIAELFLLYHILDKLQWFP